MQSHEIFFHNPIGVDIATAEPKGRVTLDAFLSVAISEGYKGDGIIFNAVRDELEKYHGRAVVEFCRSLRTFDLVEVGFIMPEVQFEIADERWYGGYLHTLEVSRTDEIETHPSILLCSIAGNRILCDLHKPTKFVRGSSRDELICQTLTPVETAFKLAMNMLNRLKECEREVLDNPITQVKRCYLPASAVEGIERELDKSRSTRYELICAMSRFAHRHDYEVAVKYFYSAGRVMLFKD